MKPFIRSVGTLIGLLRAEYRQLHKRYGGKFIQFEGNAKEICEQVVDHLWDGNFYRTSLGHFDFYWMRDFGTVAQSLVKTGRKDNVIHTLHWALFHYRRAGTITTCIDGSGHTFNAPASRSIDALPWLLHSIVVSDYELNGPEHAFLQKQLRKYIKNYLDPKTGDLKSAHYAELRDAVLYDRSSYSIALIARMAFCAEKLGLTAFRFSWEKYKQDLLDYYWSGEYFYADRKVKAFSGEGALMPFFLGIIDDPDMVAKTCDYITKAKLNAVYPLQYGEHPELFKYRWGMGPAIMPNYTGTTIWTWHGTFYLHILKRFKRPEYKTQYEKFSELIERHKTYPELVNPDGSWYYAPLYKAGQGMVWAALYLEL